MVGCDKENVKEVNGRFKQESIELPDIQGIYDFNKLGGNTLCILAQGSGNIFTIYESYNNGKDWGNRDFSLPGDNINNKYVLSASINIDNKIAIIYSDTKNIEEIKPSNTHAKMIDSNKNSVDIQLNDEQKKNISKIAFDAKGDLICLSNNNIIQIDGKSGQVKYEYKDGGTADFCLNPDKLITQTNDSVIEYTLGTEKSVGTLEKIKEYMEGNFKLYSSKEDDTVYFSNSDGLYKYSFDNDEVEKVIDGATNSFGDNGSFTQFLIKNNEGNYLAITYDTNNKYQLTGYTYTEVDESDELVLYSLHESEYIGKAISKYEKDNKEISIRYEIGITEGSGVTEPDAIRTLNTEIMAGTGPDILLMDNMSIESYIKKGLLEDISEIVDSKKDELFNNIVTSYLEDKEIYAFPLRFEMPVILGGEKYINSINNIDSLTNEIEEIKKNDSGQILQLFEPEDIVNLLYNTSGGTWVNEDNTCNKENIKNYLENCKEIYNIIQTTLNKSDYDYNSEGLKHFTEGDKYNYSINGNLNAYSEPSALLNKKYSKLVIGNISSFENLLEIIPMLNYNKDLSYKIFSAQEEEVFIPREIVAVNSKSKKKDLAKKFIDALLDEELQYIDNFQGIPVNKTALINKFKSHSEDYSSGETKYDFNDGVSIKYDNKWITETEMNKFIENIENLKSPSKYNSTYLYDVSKEAANYISGKSSLDDTVDKIASKIQLSLAEK